MQPTYKNITGIVLLCLLGIFSWLMLKIVWLYTPMRLDIGFLQLKQAYIHMDAWRIAFFVHVFSSMFVLIAGFTQFSPYLLRQKPLLHRRLGYAYVINILLVTGPAGLLMSVYANGGIASRIAFVLLSILWIGFTAMAWYKAVKKQFIAHRQYMIRSYALTLSALSLRLWKVILAELTDLRPLDRYRLIAWLGWGLNLLVAEWIIYNEIKRRKSTAAYSNKQA